MQCSFIIILLALCLTSHAQTFVVAEGDLTWQSRNDQSVPGDTGTPFSVSDLEKGPWPTYRIYVGHIWNNRHEIRGLYAPLEFEASGSFNKTINFEDVAFSPNTSTDVFYKFNSYRLTYAYHFDKMGDWELALGFTAKIRDAEVRVTQGGLRKSKSNVGFVPLLNFQARRAIADDWFFRFDFDGLAAPQGRAIDAALFIERILPDPRFRFFAGYRTIEGGADNDEVYSFAWIHKAVVGLRGEF